MCFDGYDDFVARKVDMKVSFENFAVMPFMDRYDLLDWKCYEEKHYGM